MVNAFKNNNIRYKIDAYTWKSGEDEIEGIGKCKSSKEFVAYDEILRRTLSANVVLDIIKNDMPLTLRVYEAVVYNKKLLTNNRKILTFKYYDPRYIQFFESVEDIDWDWIKEVSDVDYGYMGDFSPKKILSQL